MAYLRTCRLRFLDKHTVEYLDDTHTWKSSQTANDELFNDAVGWLSRTIKDYAPFWDAESIKLLGRHLYEMAFPAEIRTDFELTLRDFEKNSEPGKKLRLILEFTPAAQDLAGLPWEFLYLYRKGQLSGFLAGQLDELILTRIIPKPNDDAQDSPQPAKAYRPAVLLVVSHPEGLKAVVADDLLRHLRSLQENDSIILRDIDNTTYTKLGPKIESLLSEIGRSNWDVIHFVGHGESQRLYLPRDPDAIDRDQRAADREKAAGRPALQFNRFEAVDSNQVTELMAVGKPRVVFLQACHTAAIDQRNYYSTLYNIAHDLVTSDVPAVVAMQYDIEGDAANAFAQRFYTELAIGGTVGSAVREGRRQLATRREQSAWGHRDFGTPVVYLRRLEDFAIAPTPTSDSGSFDQPHAHQAPMSSIVTTKPCPRCRTQVRYQVCSNCRWRMVHKECGQETEYIEDYDYASEAAFCGYCETEFKQQAYVVGQLGTPRQPAVPGSAGTQKAAPPIAMSLPPVDVNGATGPTSGPPTYPAGV